MQPSALFWQAAVVPKTREALRSFIAEDFDESSLPNYFVLELSERIEPLWRNGVIESINLLAGALIGEYEEETIPAEKAIHVVAAMNAASSNTEFSEDVLATIMEIAALGKTAIEINMPMFFIL